MQGMSSRLDEISWPRRTQRLSIRPAEASDSDTTWPIRKDPEVSRWITSAPQTLEDYRAYFQKPERLEKTLVVELDGLVVGDLMLAIEDAWSQTEVAEQARGVQAELGWCIGTGYQGHGYAREAIEELLRICFEDLSLRRVVANCFADNVASWRLMERLGMRRELYSVRESLHRSGEWLDGMGYALLAEEWRGRDVPAAVVPASAEVDRGEA